MPLPLPLSLSLPFLLPFPKEPALSEFEYKSATPAMINLPFQGTVIADEGLLSFYFSPFFAQKTHVKPPNHLTRYQSTTSAWRISSTPTVILDIDQKKASPGRPPGVNY
jgi:hypothetical protein